MAVVHNSLYLLDKGNDYKRLQIEGEDFNGLHVILVSIDSKHKFYQQNLF